MSIPLPPPAQKRKRLSIRDVAEDLELRFIYLSSRFSSVDDTFAQLRERLDAIELSILAHKARLDWIDAWLTKSTEK